MAIAMRYVSPLVLCQLVVPVVTGTRRLEKEDASAQGAMVNSTYQCMPIDEEDVYDMHQSMISIILITE
jgi:hypothetical protein